MSSSVLVKRLLVLFGEPKTDDPEAFIAEYRNAVQDVDPNVLKLAGDLIVRERKYRSWPTVADMLDVVDRAALKVKSAKGDAQVLEEIKDFDRWWTDIKGQMRNAQNLDDIRNVIALVRPYWSARWIAYGRMDEIEELARERQFELGLTARSKAMSGDREDAA